MQRTSRVRLPLFLAALLGLSCAIGFGASFFVLKGSSILVSVCFGFAIF